MAFESETAVVVALDEVTAAPRRRGRSRASRVAISLGVFIVTLALTFLGLLAITFFIGRVVPIDPVLAVVGDRATKAVYDAAKTALGLDRPLLLQFASYVWDVLHGNLGLSVSTGQPVAADLLRVFPATLEMATLGILLGVLLGVPIGVTAATRQGGPVDQVIRVVGLMGYAVPAFWLGLVGLALFYARLRWVSGPGRVDIFYDGVVGQHTGLMLVDSLIEGNTEVFWNALRHLILPALALALPIAVAVGRTVTSALQDVMRQPYIRTARGAGLSETAVVLRHGLRNAASAPLAMAGLQVALLFGNLLVVERVFAWPGLGLYAEQAFALSDLPAVLGVSIVFGALYILVSIGVEIAQSLADRRIVL